MLELPRSAAPWRRLSRQLRIQGIVRNNALLFIANITAGFFNYVFHFALGRLLGPAAYSVLASAVSAVYLFTLPSLIIQLVSARFTSVAAARGDHPALRPLIRLLTLASLGLGGAIGLAIWFLKGVVARFLQLPDSRIVVVLAATTLLGMLISTNRGVLQGLLRFGTLSLNLIIDTGTRLLVSVGLALAGLGTVGAAFGLLAGPLVAYVQSIPSILRLPRGTPGQPVDAADVARYAAPTVAAVVGVTYLFNVDVVLARHYLGAHQAGIYAAGAVLARAVYFIGVTIAAVMFPEVAARHARDEAHFHVVDLSLLFLAAVGIVLVAAYVLVPAVVLLPYGNQFAAVRPYLGTFAAALMLLALSYLLVTYFLSVNSTRFIAPLLGAGLLETALMAAFHRDLTQLLAMLLLTNVLLAMSLGILYLVDRTRAFRRIRTAITD